MNAHGMVRKALGTALLAALAACGGGGGDSTGGSVTGPLAITAANADSAARVGAQAAGSVAMIGGASTSFAAITGQQVTVAQVRRAHAMAVAALGTQRRVAGTGTVLCGGGGSLTITFNDSNADDLLNRAGESISLTANNCSDGAGSTTNGTFSLQVSTYTDATHLSFTLAFVGFRTSDTTQGTAAAIDGSVTAALSGVANITATSPSLSISATSSGVSRSFGVQGFSMSYADNGTAVTESVAGTFTSSEFQGQSVQVSTLVPVVILWTDDYPSQGMLQVTGANNSSIKVEALNAVQAQIYIDANGDGGFETTKVVNWSTLD